MNEMKNEIQLFDEILTLRNKLKAIQQLSWELSQLDRRYPLEQISSDQYESLRKAYLDRLRQAREVIKDEKLETTHTN